MSVVTRAAIQHMKPPQQVRRLVQKVVHHVNGVAGNGQSSITSFHVNGHVILTAGCPDGQHREPNCNLSAERLAGDLALYIDHAGYNTHDVRIYRAGITMSDRAELERRQTAFRDLALQLSDRIYTGETLECLLRVDEFQGRLKPHLRRALAGNTSSLPTFFLSGSHELAEAGIEVAVERVRAEAPRVLQADIDLRGVSRIFRCDAHPDQNIFQKLLGIYTGTSESGNKHGGSFSKAFLEILEHLADDVHVQVAVRDIDLVEQEIVGFLDEVGAQRTFYARNELPVAEVRALSDQNVWAYSSLCADGIKSDQISATGTTFEGGLTVEQLLQVCPLTPKFSEFTELHTGDEVGEFAPSLYHSLMIKVFTCIASDVVTDAENQLLQGANPDHVRPYTEAKITGRINQLKTFKFSTAVRDKDNSQKQQFSDQDMNVMHDILQLRVPLRLGLST